MPIFDYVCRKCGYTMECLVAHTGIEIHCPKDNMLMDRQVGIPLFRFNGSGWTNGCLSSPDSVDDLPSVKAHKREQEMYGDDHSK